MTDVEISARGASILGMASGLLRARLLVIDAEFDVSDYDNIIIKFANIDSSHSFNSQDFNVLAHDLASLWSRDFANQRRPTLEYAITTATETVSWLESLQD